MPDHARRIVVVGASLAGSRTALELRELGFDGEIVLVGDEPHLPYDRPPLSKQVLAGTWPIQRSELCSEGKWAQLDIELRLGQPATQLDDGAVVVGGSRVPFDDIVLATGAAARHLPDQPTDDRIHVLRTRDDAERLRARLARGQTLVIVGGGFIGAEVAAVARGLDVEVSLVEAAPAPFARVLGNDVGGRCADLHADHGVCVLAGRTTTGFLTGGEQVGVTLDNGTELWADDVLVGVGSAPNVGWLRGSQVPIADGVPCEPTGRVVGLDRVYAVGDVSAWADHRRGGPARVEHWTSAVDQAGIVARSLLDQPTEPMPPPYFWSDQYRTKIQLVGWPDLADDVEITEALERNDACAATYYRSDELVAVVTFSAPRVLARLRPLVARSATRAEVATLAGSLGFATSDASPTY